MNLSNHLRSILALPFTVTIVIPCVLVALTRSYVLPWRFSSVLDVFITLLGVASIALGVVLLVSTISLFAKVGRGTLVPWNPRLTA
jgi:FlaA1/EpsC-like NDP-sugar epimerase